VRYRLAMHERYEEAARLVAHGELGEAERVLLSLLDANARANYPMASLCDGSGQALRAVPYYRLALAGSEELFEGDTAGAYLGLGSTYRVLGEHEESSRVLREGLRALPRGPGFEYPPRAHLVQPRRAP
jgi:tetratricopeptide (TPR) repeat protein